MLLAAFPRHAVPSIVLYCLEGLSDAGSILLLRFQATSLLITTIVEICTVGEHGPCGSAWEVLICLLKGTLACSLEELLQFNVDLLRATEVH